MEKSDLRPGMKVRNIASDNTGEVLGKKNGELRTSAPWNVMVRCRVRSGKTVGSYRQAFWIVDNLELINE